jgi:hypothetical protein
MNRAWQIEISDSKGKFRGMVYVEASHGSDLVMIMGQDQLPEPEGGCPASTFHTLTAENSRRLAKILIEAADFLKPHG